MDFIKSPVLIKIILADVLACAVLHNCAKDNLPNDFENNFHEHVILNDPIVRMNHEYEKGLDHRLVLLRCLFHDRGIFSYPSIFLLQLWNIIVITHFIFFQML